MADTEFRELLDEINDMTVIDDHSHMIPEKDLPEKNNVFSLLLGGYSITDYQVAGGNSNRLKEMFHLKDFTDEDLEIVKDFLEKVSNTTFARSNFRGIKEIFGLEELDPEEISLEILKKYEKIYRDTKTLNWQEKILKKAKIEHAILVLRNEDFNKYFDMDRRFFSPAISFWDFLNNIFKRKDLQRIENNLDISIHSIDDFLKGYDRIFERILNEKAVAIKIDMAYTRTLKIGKPSRHEAEIAFRKLFDKTLINAFRDDGEQGVAQKDLLPVQDYLLHYILSFAESVDLPVKFHTGFLANPESYLPNANPMLLLDTFREYRKVRFSLQHCGYPYINELAAMAKLNENVYPDLCWLHIIAPSAARFLLHLLIEGVPSNKVFGFGGDFATIEGTYGCLLFSKENIARVLHEKIKEGYFNSKNALRYARKILYDNPKEFYKV